jgi:hypothetical protein
VALSAVACIILQIPPTSAASERNWSLFGNTHTKAHNTLTNTRVEKLVAIQANLRLFEPDNDPSSTRLESDSKDEASESDVQEVNIEEVPGEDMEALEEDNQSFSI